MSISFIRFIRNEKMHVRLLLGVAFLSPACAVADGAPLFWPQHYQSSPQSLNKPVAVIYLEGKDALSKSHASSIEHMARQGRDDFGLKINEYPIESEDALAKTVDKVAENEVGLIVIIAPKSMDKVMKLPGMYPDLHFSIIGTPAPLYFPNVHAMQFNDQEGTFIAGALAAMTSRKQSVSFIGSDDTPYSRALAYGFLQGAKYANSAIKVNRQLGPVAASGDDADVSMALDENSADTAIAEAARQKRSVITFDHDETAEHPGVVLTSLLKHYDLALYSVLQRYQQQNWKPGNESVGLGGGYIDYALNASNKPKLDKTVIDKAESLKDLISQGAVKVAPLAQ